MAAPRYYPQDQRQGPPENQRFAPRGRSPVRYGGERHPSGSYNNAPTRRSDEYAPRPDGARDRPPVSGRGVPRGPRASLDAPRGRGAYPPPPPPAPRGRGFAPRGDIRPAFYDRDSPIESRGPDSRAEPERSWRQDSYDRRDSLPARGSQDYREARDAPPRDTREPPLRDFRGGPRDEFDPVDDPYYDSQSSRGRGRGRSREEWASRGRGRGAGRDDRGPPPLESRQASYDHGWNREMSVQEPPYEQHESKHFDRREGDRQPGRDDRIGFDPFSQDRAAAREFPRYPRPPSPAPPTPASQGFGSRPPIDSGRPGPDRIRDEASLRRAPSFHAPPDRRDSTRPDSFAPHDPSRDRFPSRPPSPPQAPSIPQFGSISIPQGAEVAKKPPTEPRAAQQAFKPPVPPTGPKANQAPPTAPRADTERQPPTAPRAVRAQEENISDRRSIEGSSIRTSPTWSQSRTWTAPAQHAITPSKPAATSPPIPSAAPVPSGPRSSTASASAPNGGITVPTGPKAIRSQQPVPVPTAPRAATGPAGSTWQRTWSQGSQQSTRPSGSLPVKRDAYGQEKPRVSEPPRAPGGSGYPHENRQNDQSRGVELKHTHDSASRLETPRSPPPRSPAWGDEPPDFGLGGRRGVTVNEERVHPGAGPMEDMMELDEDDFQKAEEQFQKEKAKLEADLIDVSTRYFRAATPLEELSLLSFISLAPLPPEEDVPQLSEGEDDSSAKNQTSTPEPYIIDTTDKYLIHDLPSPITSPILRSLPFLNKDPVVPLEELDSYKDNEARQRDILPKMFEHFELREQTTTQLEKDLCQEFADLYEPWMERVEQLDQEHRDENLESEDPELLPPPLPLLDANPMILSALSDTRRRGGAMSSEYDIAQAIQLSERTYFQEDAKRRKQESSAKFDIEKECVMPHLLDDDDLQRPVFIHTQTYLPAEDARLFLALEPLPDDFTQAEHEAVLKNFEEWPKKWGKIAQALGGRNFKECINHYYSSKWRKEFKDKRVKPKAKNARGKSKGGQLRTKANALMSNLGDAHTDPYEGDEFLMPNVAVTDSGRPRRAAAPTFGEKESEEQAQIPAISGKKGKAVPDPSQEKQGRRGKVPLKEKVPRKPKAPLAARRASMSPEKTDLKYRNDPLLAEPTHGMAEEQAYPPRQLAPGQWQYNYQEMHDDAERGSLPQENAAAMPQSRKTGMSSYWSVNEISAFNSLVRELGSDWHSIAGRLGTKTAVMCKNYYNRVMSSNPDPTLERDVREADERRGQGEQPGFLRSPVSSIRPRMDREKPQARRPLAPSRDIAEVAGRSPPLRQQELDRFPHIHAPSTLSNNAAAEGQSNSQERLHSAQPFLHEPPNAYSGGYSMEKSGIGKPPPNQYLTMSSPNSSRLQLNPSYPTAWERQTGTSRQIYTEYQRPDHDPLGRQQDRGQDQPTLATAPRQQEEQRQPMFGSRGVQDSPFEYPPRYSSGGINSSHSSFPGLETQQRPQWLGDRSSRPASPARERPPSAPAVAPALAPAPPREPRKQSNLLALLNNDEPVSRAPPLRTETPPSGSTAFLGQPPRPSSHPQRLDVTNEALGSSSRNGEYSAHGSSAPMGVHSRREEPTPNWAAGLTYAAPAQSQSQSNTWLDSRGRGTPLEHHRPAMPGVEGRHIPSPPPATSRSYTPWTHTSGAAPRSPPSSSLARLSQASIAAPQAPHLGLEPLARDPGRSFARPAEDYPGTFRRAEHPEPHLEPKGSDPRSATNPTTQRRPDSFLWSGSDYKSNTAKRDQHYDEQRSRQDRPRDYRYEQEEVARRNRDAADRERERLKDEGERLNNPFFQPTSQGQRQQRTHPPDPYGPPEPRSDPAIGGGGGGLGFGPVGQQQQQQQQQPPRR